jgi:hypothetical protein
MSFVQISFTWQGIKYRVDPASVALFLEMVKEIRTEAALITDWNP